ncbi:hypothetical protein BWGOE10_56820 [Bacillus mycoides]|nr:hypothetical protein BWGOE10_56820 [Bacillus mycoides]
MELAKFGGTLENGISVITKNGCHERQSPTNQKKNIKYIVSIISRKLGVTFLFKMVI